MSSFVPNTRHFLKELSSSQQNFFKMLDEKIENGPDYDSNDETEIALETARLHALLKDWETASSSSRSLPTTPRHVPRGPPSGDSRTAHSAPKAYGRVPIPSHQPTGPAHQPIAYRHPAMVAQGCAYQSHSPPLGSSVGQQYQPVVSSGGYQDYQGYGYLPPRGYGVPSAVPNAHGSPVHYGNSSPKHRYPSPMYQQQYSSPTHKMYVAPGYSNGELMIQQQLYNQQIAQQYQQSREYQHYRQTREQQLYQQHSQHGQHSASVGPGSYQSSVHVPMAVVPQPDTSGARKRQYTHAHEIT